MKENMNTNIDFGSREWIEKSLRGRYTDTLEKVAEKLNSVTDYYQLKDIEDALWPAPAPKNRFFWIDPPRSERPGPE